MIMNTAAFMKKVTHAIINKMMNFKEILIYNKKSYYIYNYNFFCLALAAKFRLLMEINLNTPKL